MSSHGWIGVDLDGTLAYYDGWNGEHHIGAPVPLMLARVKKWLAEGKDVRVFTARVCEVEGRDTAEVVRVIQRWCGAHIGRVLPITNLKDYHMVELWDDRAVQVVPNTGLTVSEHLADVASMAAA